MSTLSAVSMMGTRGLQTGGLAGFFLCLGLSLPAHGDEGPPGGSVQTERQQDSSLPTKGVTGRKPALVHEPSAESTEKTAEQLQAFLEGTLDVGISPESLFEVRLDENLMKLVQARQKRAGRTDSAGPSNDESASERLLRLRVQFLSLPAERQQELLELHRRRQEEASHVERMRKHLQKQLEQLETSASRLEAFLEKTLDPRVDPEPLLKVNLLDSAEVGLDEARARAFTKDSKGKKGDHLEKAVDEDVPLPGGSVESADESLKSKVEAATERLDQLRMRYVALSEEDRAALLAEHLAKGSTPEPLEQVEEAVSEAEAAARRAAQEREAALAESRSARTEALRLLSEERARLLGVKEAQARFSAFISGIRRERELIQEQALTWVRKVRELEERPLLERPSPDEYDATYDELVTALTKSRDQLDVILSQVVRGERDVPSVGDLANLPKHPEAESVRKLARELSKTELSLRDRLKAARWDQAQASRDSMVNMNHARLSLMAHLSPEKRGALKGFGKPGIQQAARELKQINLEVRYHVAAVPRFFSDQFEGFGTSPIPIIFSLLKLAILIYFFRFWRRRSESTLRRLEKHFFDQTPQSVVTRSLGHAVWYGRQVHRPVEWLIFFAILAAMVESGGRVPELAYFSVVVLWGLVGGIVIRLLNAIASRQGDIPESTGKLRFRSLRLVGITVVINGMILGLAEISVGDGTLYNWVLNTCWLLALPIGLLLIHWWRPVILERARAQQNPTPIIRWVASWKKGPASFLAAAVGGAYFTYEGARRHLLRQASNLAVTQRLLAYLFRREVEKRTEAKGEHLKHDPLPKETWLALDPFQESQKLIASVNEKAADVVRRRLLSDGGSTIAVVGERGIGKTTFLDQVVKEFADNEVLKIQCPLGGFRGAVAEIGRALGLSDVGVDAVLERLRNSPIKIIAVDDAGRLVRPLIGGLSDIDRLVEFARASGSSSWVLTIATPSWQYLKRARGERAVFDEVARLRPFTEREISQLISLRSEQANIQPKYDELVVPRQIEASEIGSNKDNTERDYSRILWDYSDGNPAVALHFFRESLGVKNGEIYVRLFRTPSLVELEDLPSTVYFVLRSIVQLEQALEADIVSCTALHPDDVSAALRASHSKKLTERVGERIRIHLPWYRAITSVLQRHHLLMRSA